jgi:6-phosphogluconate dehydrogenase
MANCDLGLIGLAVMGQNLVLNMNDNGFKIAVFNRTTAKVTKFMENEAAGTNVEGALTLEEFVGKLKKPRRVMLLVMAGKPVDDFIEKLIPLLEPEDIIIDGGNSHYPDTNRRCQYLAEKGMHFIGSGVSGGEEGARHGPSIMPGGADAAWPHVKDIFQAISAKAGTEPCCDWVGQGGAGHYVKMVHNGIEYGDMQLICEAYNLMKSILGMTNDEMAAVFTEWNKGELDSYLIEISAAIMAFKDEQGEPLVEKIMDRAGQKGTGKWTVISSLEAGVPVSLIGESVFARCLSAMKEERVHASTILEGPNPAANFTAEEKAQVVEDIRQALYASKIVSYAQGFMLMREEAKQQGWNLNFGGVALMWRGGCIIRSRFLGNIKEAFEKNPNLDSLLLDDFFKEAIHASQAAWRRVCGLAVVQGVPCPAFTTALAFYDGYRSPRLPANLLQAQRDYFGAHTYQRLDSDEWTHTNWTGTGGTTSSSTYNA